MILLISSSALFYFAFTVGYDYAATYTDAIDISSNGGNLRLARAQHRTEPLFLVVKFRKTVRVKM
jgi:hypothetical protein